MDIFEVNRQFGDFKSLLEVVKNYQSESNNVLVISGSHKLKGEGDFVTNTVYERIAFECKAGKERPCRSSGVRTSSTYKLNCPFQVKLALVKGKLTIKSSNPIHENHNSDKRTFLSYPENVRLKESEILEARKMIQCGSSKQKLKAFLMKDRDAPVSLKSLHNLQTKMHQSKEGVEPAVALRKLVEMMLNTPNTKVRVIENNEEDFVGIYFQDDRMAQVFDKYPEILFFDATGKLNNIDLSLFIQLCMDGNGESEIVSLYICKSESRESIGSMIDVFKSLNKAWTSTSVIIGDKDLADRAVYSEKFIDAVLQICLFHVQQTFRREITTVKRSITNTQRDQVLEILQRLVYSQSETSYNEIYKELTQLNLEDVTEYYNDNWLNIRNEWTLYGRNKHCNYMNGTNNRIESLNQKIKLIGNRHANLLTFFENLSITVTNLSSEKDLKAIRGTMKMPRIRFDDHYLKMYNDLLTPFIFAKVFEQYELADKVKFVSMENNSAVVQSGHTVTGKSCSCLFVTSMNLPCRHIFKFMKEKFFDMFAPDLCAKRWTKTYYNSSHPALTPDMTRTDRQPTYVKVRIPNEVDRFKKSAAVTKDINNIAARLSTGQHTYLIEKLKILKDEMLSIDRSQPANTEMRPTTNTEEIGVQSELVTLPTITETHPVTNIDERDVIVTPRVINREVERNVQLIQCSSVNQQAESAFSQKSSIEILSSIENIIMPRKVVAPGRPKGSGKTTVIGTQRKTTKRKQSEVGVSEDVSPQKNKFDQMDQNEQTFTIIRWLTDFESSDILKKKITIKDIVRDPNTFNRLRNDNIFLGSLKKYLDPKCFDFLKDEVAKLYGKPWNCSHCNLNLNGKQISCSICLDWFHVKCVTLKKSMKGDFLCTSCV